jgi:hypothetical protein
MMFKLGALLAIVLALAGVIRGDEVAANRPSAWSTFSQKMKSVFTRAPNQGSHASQPKPPAGVERASWNEPVATNSAAQPPNAQKAATTAKSKTQAARRGSKQPRTVSEYTSQERP